MSDTNSEDRASLCDFTWSDGRQCRMLRSSSKSKYCLHHERRLRHFGETEKTASYIAEPITAGDFVPASALTHSLARVFLAVAEGRIEPKRATALARVGATLLRSICESSRELEECCNDKYWSQLIWSHYKNTPDFKSDDEN